MSRRRLLTRGLSPLGSGRARLTMGMVPRPATKVIDGITSNHIPTATVAGLDQMTSWGTPSADDTTVELHSTLGAGALASGMPLEVIQQAQQRRSVSGVTADDVVRVRWSSDSAGGFDELVFEWR